MTDTINQVGASAPADRLREALAGLLAIVDESRGVSGYHLNGAIAEWDEFPEVEAARATLADLPECGCCGQTGECDAGCDARLAAPAAPVRMCTTMGRPVSECGCPDCGSSLIDWTAAPAVQNAGIQAALDYSRNFANSKPGIGRTEKEHILGLVSLLERVAATAAPVADGTTSDKYRAELYDEVWQRARDMGYGNVTDALVELERLKAAAPVVQAEQQPVAFANFKEMELCMHKPAAGAWEPVYAAPPAHPDAALVEVAQAALKAIQDTLEDAYHNAFPECCGQAHLECCGSPVRAWDERDQKIMDRIAPHEQALRAALAGKGGTA